MTEQGKGSVPAQAADAVLVKSEMLPGYDTVIKGYDFNDSKNGQVDYCALLDSYLTSGFQAQNFGEALSIIDEMLRYRRDDSENDEPNNEEVEPKPKKATIFMGYTSNLISSGLRETLRFLVQHKLVDCIVTTAGGVEEDVIKCLGPTYAGEFALRGEDLRKKGLNRIGNLLIPNDNYCSFEDWVTPILDKLVEEQTTKEEGCFTPSEIIERLGLEINDESSVLYWAAKNRIPIFCPALTDGSLGDMIFFHSYRNPGLKIDIARDLRAVNTMAMKADRTGMLIFGGGVIKHHICNANLMRNGADYAVYVNTSQEFDGSDAGARPDEAVSWGKIRMGARSTKIYADATLIVPLLVARAVVPYHHQQVQKGECVCCGK
eukprot:Clim_evm107s149 gene=Clim_evmTU107s149